MMIILDRYAIPDKGTFEIRQLVTLELSAEQARKIVNHFLLMEVSTMLAADAPDLVIGDQTVWRVPVWIGFLQQGRFQAGVMDVDVKTGAILNQDERTAAIQARAAELAAGLPPYVPNQSATDEFLAADTLPITIEVDASVAQSYNAASNEVRRKLNALLSLKLTEVLRSDRTLEEVMDALSRNAQERGLTEEILNELLRDE